MGSGLHALAICLSAFSDWKGKHAFPPSPANAILRGEPGVPFKLGDQDADRLTMTVMVNRPWLIERHSPVSLGIIFGYDRGASATATSRAFSNACNHRASPIKGAKRQE
jgi:hypothetical protein